MSVCLSVFLSVQAITYIHYINLFYTLLQNNTKCKIRQQGRAHVFPRRGADPSGGGTNIHLLGFPKKLHSIKNILVRREAPPPLGSNTGQLYVMTKKHGCDNVKKCFTGRERLIRTRLIRSSA